MASSTGKQPKRPRSLEDRLFGPLGVEFPEPPEILYHYTDHAGLAGILNGRTLWASNLLFMNDARELQEGMSVFDRAIERAEAKGLIAGDREPFGDWYLNGPELNVSFGIFGVCFSERGDDLSQWRAYAPRGGYALGFSGPELQEMHTRGIASLDRVIYDDAAKERIAEETVAAAIEVWREVQSAPAKQRERRIERFREALERVVRHAVCIMKHSSFAAEAEWRLFVANADLTENYKVKYRAGRNFVIPYAEIPIKVGRRRILRSARAGPAAHQSVALSGLIGCVVDNGFDKVDVSSSEIPFRL